MLDAPRELLAAALFPLKPSEPPPKPLLPFAPPPGEMSRLPTLSPPPAARLPALGLAARFPPLADLLLTPALSRLEAPPAARLLAFGDPPARLFCWPRVWPPYLFAVALLPYGVPPRWDELCDQLLFPPRLMFVLWLMFVLRLKLLLTLMLTLL
jgi:hypothetical protein